MKRHLLVFLVFVSTLCISQETGPVKTAEASALIRDLRTLLGQKNTILASTPVNASLWATNIQNKINRLKQTAPRTANQYQMQLDDITYANLDLFATFLNLPTPTRAPVPVPAPGIPTAVQLPLLFDQSLIKKLTNIVTTAQNSLPAAENLTFDVIVELLQNLNDTLGDQQVIATITQPLIQQAVDRFTNAMEQLCGQANKPVPPSITVNNPDQAFSLMSIMHVLANGLTSCIDILLSVGVPVDNYDAIAQDLAVLLVTCLEKLIPSDESEDLQTYFIDQLVKKQNTLFTSLNELKSKVIKNIYFVSQLGKTQKEQSKTVESLKKSLTRITDLEKEINAIQSKETLTLSQDQFNKWINQLTQTQRKLKNAELIEKLERLKNRRALQRQNLARAQSQLNQIAQIVEKSNNKQQLEKVLNIATDLLIDINTTSWATGDKKPSVIITLDKELKLQRNKAKHKLMALELMAAQEKEFYKNLVAQYNKLNILDILTQNNPQSLIQEVKDAIIISQDKGYAELKNNFETLLKKWHAQLSINTELQTIIGSLKDTLSKPHIDEQSTETLINRLDKIRKETKKDPFIIENPTLTKGFTDVKELIKKTRIKILEQRTQEISTLFKEVDVQPKPITPPSKPDTDEPEESTDSLLTELKKLIIDDFDLKKLAFGNINTIKFYFDKIKNIQLDERQTQLLKDLKQSYAALTILSSLAAEANDIIAHKKIDLSKDNFEENLKTVFKDGSEKITSIFNDLEKLSSRLEETKNLISLGEDLIAFRLKIWAYENILLLTKLPSSNKISEFFKKGVPRGEIGVRDSYIPGLLFIYNYLPTLLPKQLYLLDPKKTLAVVSKEDAPIYVKKELAFFNELSETYQNFLNTQLFSIFPDLFEALINQMSATNIVGKKQAIDTIKVLANNSNILTIMSSFKKQVSLDSLSSWQHFNPGNINEDFLDKTSKQITEIIADEIEKNAALKQAFPETSIDLLGKKISNTLFFYVLFKDIITDFTTAIKCCSPAIQRTMDSIDDILSKKP